MTLRAPGHFFLIKYEWISRKENMRVMDYVYSRVRNQLHSRTLHDFIFDPHFKMQ